MKIVVKKILFNNIDYIFGTDNNIDENSLTFICKIYENCPSIEYLQLVLSPSIEHFAEFEKLLKVCKNLKSLSLIVLNNDYKEIEEEILDILINSAPTNLREIGFFDDFRFSLENLEEFLEKWRGRPALSILTSNTIYKGEDYMKLINKYKNEGVIKDLELNRIHF